MKSAALDRLETLLRARHLDGTLTAAALKRLAAARTASTGVPALNRALDGGWRRGELSEIVGGRSSGRTSVLVATLAAATARGEIVGLVDACDRFDPIGAAEAGVDLARVLWVRGPQILVEAARPAVVESAVERALRALDLFVRAGGFAVAALDLADVPPRFVKALPFTTWMRLGHANEGRDTVCLLVGDAPMGRSPGGVSVRLAAKGHWTGASPQRRRLDGLDICPVVSRADRFAESVRSADRTVVRVAASPVRRADLLDPPVSAGPACPGRFDRGEGPAYVQRGR